MSAALVIVESPAKASTISGYLGADYVVESSIGHIRDLPNKATNIPKRYKNESWARLGIDVEHDFKPLYIIPPDKRKQITKLKTALASAKVLYLATDGDREGEAIAWHLQQVLKPHKDVAVKRMVFHEITAPAIQSAIQNSRDIDRRLVDSQEARRILDRLYGYEVSPVLWKKVQPGLSAGRVQSVATRIIVERERERIAFVAAEYWNVTAALETKRKIAADIPKTFSAGMVSLEKQSVANGSNFDLLGRLKRKNIIHLDERAATAVIRALSDTKLKVLAVDKKPFRRRPAPPFMTSTLQQEASRKLGMTATTTMRIAQSLYEKGLITYMRTDSSTLSKTAHDITRDIIQQDYGQDFLPAAPRSYNNKVKNAQEAHEAIRPTGSRFSIPTEAGNTLSQREAQLYELIWMRTVASQMTDAIGNTVQVRIGGTTADGRHVEFVVSGTTISHDGFRKIYSEGTDERTSESDVKEHPLPPLKVGDLLETKDLALVNHTTLPPARFTEASLVRRLESLGVGRPSTYATIMTTIQDRGYVWKKRTALVPTFTAFAVINLLEQHFPNLVDYTFTARMEDDLDNIATGDEEIIPWLNRFYFGAKPSDNPGLKGMVSDRLGSIDARAVNSLAIGSDNEGADVFVRVGRYGTFVQKNEERTTVPDDLAPDELNLEKALELIETSNQDRLLGQEPDTGIPVWVRSGRFGPYIQLGEDDKDRKNKPKTASLLTFMSPDTVTLDDALQLLSLPRIVGNDLNDGNQITAHYGRYGPYIKKGTENRTLSSEEKLFTISVEECSAIFVEPKRGRTQAGKKDVRELGVDPATSLLIKVRDGRWGAYVTDGKINASLHTGDTLKTISLARATELIQLRRDRGPSPKRRTSKNNRRKKTL